MKRVIITQPDEEFYASDSGLALERWCVNELRSPPAKAMDAFPVTSGSKGIGLHDILPVILARSQRAKAIAKREPIAKGTTTSGKSPRYRQSPFRRNTAPMAGGGCPSRASSVRCMHGGVLEEGRVCRHHLGYGKGSMPHEPARACFLGAI